MSRVFGDYLRDMLDNAQRAIGFVDGMDFEEFARDEKTVYAVIRAIEIIGEAARSIPEDIRARYPDIPWRDVAGMRNKLVHQYFGVNKRVIWQTIQEDLPMLIEILGKILR